MTNRIVSLTAKTLCILLFACTCAHAQSGIATPYSRYAIGDLLFNGFARQTAMGGIGAAYHSPSSVNFSNPASYGNVRITTFEMAMRGEYSKISNGSESGNHKGATLGYMTLGFPVIKDNWGACLGLIPYSVTGYDLVQSGELNADTATYNYDKKYTAKGGLSRFYIGNGFAPFAKGFDKFQKSKKRERMMAEGDSMRVHKMERKLKLLKGFAFGFNASYMFGSIDKERRVVFSNSYIFNTKVINNTSYGDFYFDYGLQYAYDFKNDYKLSVGLSGAASANLKARRDVVWTLHKGTTFESDIDTVYFSENEKGKTVIPQTWNAGIVLQKGDKWLAGAEYASQNWSKYESFGEKDNLVNSYRISFGGQYAPTEKLSYRAGYRFTKTYLDLKNTPINDNAISIGLGVPIRLSSAERRLTDNKTMLHFTIEGGQRGTTSNNLIKHQYLRFYIGITANELWFIKRRFD